ncbi:NAD(P)/FAD-dependent oxidoreductase [Roseomonas frigidaquae]|uniref:NAD(P)/FAD-dependent oxidoreductase n=1 Tax=Falsiroseomonas frigidaquae TaxID=487318 RepID=A0ABX1F2R8_9PROT|nr:NAD(P)/FAD-dependent oxidoreductase [Falsiroseomonas frigidaquae]NKE46652.1 NAD(P)/FAD-dependent oxidoreductase [Falsiroseomonas frigidaquae]
MTHFDVVVLGAGAAGLFAAMRAGQRGRRVLLLDHAEAAGKKILISGGGRCNFTNTGCVPERFLSANPHFARSALARYTQHDFIGLVRKHGIPFHEKTLGQLFCDGSARAIVAMLLAECSAAGVDLRLSHRITDLTRDDRFRITTDRGGFTADSLVLATGGLSIPKMGATGFAHDVARRFGLKLVAPRPGLVPLTFAGDLLALMQPLSGVALEAVAKAGKAAFREALLFTHRGLSGPAILQASSYWQEGQAITLDLAPERDATALLLAGKRARPKAEPKTILGEFLPSRLAQAMAALHLPPRVIGEVGDAPLKALGALLKAWRLEPSGSEGYAKAEVTLGGIDTAGLSSQTMMAKDIPGLFAVGEAVDVTGWLGGYNFQWAWSSGWVAGESA